MTGNKRHLTGINLCNAPANLSNLRRFDVWRDLVNKALNKSLGELSALCGGKLLGLFEDVRNCLGHRF